MKCSSICLSIPIVYAIASGIELNQANKSFLTLIFLQTMVSMYHRQIESQFTLQMDRTIICAIWLYLAFLVNLFYCILFSALFCLYNTYVCKTFTFITVPLCMTVYIYHSERLKLLKLLLSSTPILYYYDMKYETVWTAYIWHAGCGLAFCVCLL